MARFIAYDSPRAFLSPTKETMDGIEQAIRWAETEVPQQLRRKMNELVFHMALVNQRFARKMSFGPRDPSGQRSELAWKMPVRRISENYYLGWKVRRISPAVWQLYNDSREASPIEFGINWLGAGRRVRRPVRKLTLRQTMHFMMTTQAYHRIWVDAFSSPRHRHRGLGFTQTVQSPAGRWINMTDREIGSMIRGYDRTGNVNFRIRQGSKGQVQRWRANTGGGGSYGGKQLGRRLP